MRETDKNLSKLRLGTRGSELALHQAKLVKDLLLKAGVPAIQIVTIKTHGDQETSLPFTKMEGRGFFTKEIERALLDGEIDLAVHSLKDLETTPPAGLQITTVPVRDTRRELLIIRPQAAVFSLPLCLKESAIIGTSSVRRIAQLFYHRPDLQVRTLRGNVPTRVRKLQNGEYDAIIIAAAGVRRLGLALDGLETVELDEHFILPPPGQGALAVQTRADDEVVNAVVRKIDDDNLRVIVEMEREVLRRMGGGCHIPLGVIGDRITGGFRLSAFLGIPDDNSWQRPRRVSTVAKTPAEAVGAVVTYLERSPGGDRSGGIRGKRVVITRSRTQSADFCAMIEAGGGEVVLYPTLKVVPAGDPVRNKEIISRLDRYDWVLFSSANGVEEFFRLLNAAHLNLSESIRVGVVGRGTEAAFSRSAGRTADFVPAVSSGEGFAAEFAARYGGGKRPVLVPGAAERRGLLEKKLQDEGFEVEAMVIYNTVCPEPGEMPDWNGQADAVVFTSPKAARFFQKLAQIPESARVISIGRLTSEYLAGEGILPVYEAFEHDMNGVVEVLNVLYG